MITFSEQFKTIKAIENLRQSRVLVLASSNLEMEFVPELFDTLMAIGKSERLDVVLYGRGGEINAARRIGLLLRSFCDQLAFIVPLHCQSACTVLSLSGQEIIAGEMACFSPIDPRLNAESGINESGPGSLASEDIRLFCEMGEKWFGLEGQDTRRDLLASVASSIFPTSLTSAYRASLELKSIAEELIGFQLPHVNASKRADIVDHLIFGYNSHSFAITGKDLMDLGLNIVRDNEVERLAWEISSALRNSLGGGARQTPEDPRYDVLIASRNSFITRKHERNAIAPAWQYHSKERY